MSDSDSTWPATEDFESRFLEVDELECHDDDNKKIKDEVPLRIPRQQAFSKHITGELSSATHGNTSRRVRDCRRRSYREMDLGKGDDSDVDVDVDPLVGKTSSKPRRSSGRNIFKLDFDWEDEGNEEDTTEIPNFSKPKPLTARQRSIQKQRDGEAITSPKGKTHFKESGLLTLESMEVPKCAITPTPEQLVARQQIIERRRESAKHKAELQKRQTVERLLKINADSDGFGKRSRGRGFRGRVFPTSGSTTSLLSASSNLSGGHDESESSVAALSSHVDEEEDSNQENSVELSDANLLYRINLAKRHGLNESSMDPRDNYIRCISSKYLSPSNCVSCSPGSDGLLRIPSSSGPLPVPSPRLCAMGCGRSRRYTCSTTGVPVCSLACYKQNMSTVARPGVATSIT